MKQDEKHPHAPSWTRAHYLRMFPLRCALAWAVLAVLSEPRGHSWLVIAAYVVLVPVLLYAYDRLVIWRRQR
jgi:hypothetical protein